jgi:hypothetical protein
VAVKHLTYAELSELWGVSREAARKKVEGLRLPRRPGNDGRTRVAIDLEEVTHTPKPSASEGGGRPAGDREEVPPETARPPAPEVLAMQAQIATLEARAGELRADLERERGETERERAERHQERERADHLAGEVAALARQLATVVEEAGARERALHARLEVLTAARRRWWPFRRAG